MHRDSPGIEPEADETDANRLEPPRRFQRLVESSAARRLAVPRLGLALGVALSVVVSVWFVGTWAVRSLTSFVAGLPDQEISFSQIELVPDPDPWVKGQRARILSQAKSAWKRGETLRLLDLNLKELTNAFVLGSPWVQKVNQIKRTPRGLTVYLEYRKPVAMVVVEAPGKKPLAYPVDDHAVPLWAGEINWRSADDTYWIEGMAEPLVQIWGVDRRAQPSYGIPWKVVREDGTPGDPDEMVLKATRLARFLQGKSLTPPSTHPGSQITRILIPEGPSFPYFLKDQDKNRIRWGKTPGDEEPGELTSEARWALLVERYARPEPINAKTPYFLNFDKNRFFLDGPAAPKN